ncbi:MAG: EamA family transporter [Chitinophagaceae bacterium]|nr:EamA family transporter [Chitinophagaceae bacterium]
MAELNKKIASPFMVILAFATVYIVWGSTYFFIQKAVHGFPPFLLGAVRFLIAGMIMLAWSISRGEKIFVKQDMKHAAIGGVLMLFVGNGAVIWVEQYMPSAMVAILISSSPIWFVVLDKPKWAENFRSKAIITGLLIGFAGVVLLFGEKIFGSLSEGSGQLELTGMALLVVGSMSWAGGSLYAKYKPSTGSATVSTAWQMLIAGIAFIPGSFFRNELQGLQWQNIPTDAWLSLFYLIFFGSIAAFSAYVWLLKVRSATQVSTYAYVNPVVAVLLGVFFANENISLLQVVGLVIILGSVLIINMAKHKKDRAHTEKKEGISSETSEPHTENKVVKRQVRNHVESGEVL